MRAYHKEYLSDVVETQGKLFDFFAMNFPTMNTEDFIEKYMKSNTRQFIEEGQVYVNTMNVQELWDYFLKYENYTFVQGQNLEGFMPDWIGEFYAYYQWYYNISSKELIKKIPLSFLKKAYFGLHDLELELAVQKVGL